MIISRILVCLVIAGIWQCAVSHHLRHHNNAGDSWGMPGAADETISAKSRRSLQSGFYNKNGSEADKDKIPYSYKKLDKMMKKAILQIILGDLHPADMLLLKALNYTLEEVMAIREHELSRIKEEKEFEAKLRKQQEQELLSAKYQAAAMHRRSSTSSSSATGSSSSSMSSLAHQRKKISRENNFEAYNRQAVYDYENGPVAVATSSSKLDYDEAKGEENDSGNDKDNDNANEKDSAATEESLRQNFDRAMEPHVVFKIRYDDSEFDSGSDEKSRIILKNHHSKTILKVDKAKSSAASSFQVSGTNNGRTGAAADAAANLEENYQVDGPTRSSNLDDLNRRAVVDYENLVPGGKLGMAGEVDENADDKALLELAKKREREFASHEDFERALNGSRLEDMEQRNESAATETSSISKKGEEVEEEATATATTAAAADKKRVSEYEGLEWVGGDVYRVIPEAMEALLNYEDELAAAAAAAAEYESRGEEEEDLRQTSYSSLDDLVNDTFEYQSDAADSPSMYAPNGNFTDNQNLTTYQRLALAQRRDQGQKAIEDIKLRVLAMTGRFNLTSSNNQVQRERLTMFSPICQMPRNTDAEAWADPFSMNMHFQLNLTSGEHVLAAKLRLFKLPQDTATSPSSSSSTYEEDEEDEKKIRVSVYFYTKSLKKHRAKKRLMDSIVTPLTAQGSHLALDVRQGLRFWRPGGGGGHSGHPSSGNHGLVVQVEDQDGRPLKPALYFQEPTCQAASSGAGAGNADADVDEKAYQYVPALFVRACTRYVRIVNDKVEMYVQCRPSQRH